MAKRTSNRRSAANAAIAAPQVAESASLYTASSIWPVLAWIAVLVVAGAAVYWNSLNVPFLFDDLDALPQNETIRRRVIAALSPPPATTVSGRPVLNLSFALNYAIGGLNLRALHATNIAIHIACALLLFGIVRWVLLKSERTSALRSSATTIAGSSALLWEVHPLNTESVTYLVQRAESLAALFYLLTVYCGLRGLSSPRPIRWFAPAFASFVLGFGVKEILVACPVVLLLCDRAFFSGSIRSALRRNRTFYGSLFVSALVLGTILVVRGRPGSAGFGEGDIKAFHYAATQVGVLVHYIRLCFMPWPLVFDYMWQPVSAAYQVLLPAVVLLPIGVAAVWALAKNRVSGFLAASFFLILAPTSSIVPIATEGAAEHRMYLPLATICVGTVGGSFWLAQRARELRHIQQWLIAVYCCVAAVLSAATVLRNNEYASATRIWSDTLAKRPENWRAHYSLGKALEEQEGRANDALREYQTAAALHPTYQEALANAARLLSMRGDAKAALDYCNRAVQANPNFAQAYSNRSLVLRQLDRNEDALADLDRAIQLNPAFADAWFNRGNLRAAMGKSAEALEDWHQAAKLDPRQLQARMNAGHMLEQLGNTAAAAVEYKAAMQADSTFAPARERLAKLKM